MIKRKSSIPKTPVTMQRRIFLIQSTLIVLLSLFLATAGIIITTVNEMRTDATNLQNIAESVAHSDVLREDDNSELKTEYFDSLYKSLSHIDVISIIDLKDLKRIYHSNHELIGTTYDGTIPNFSEHTDGYYVEKNNGPSGMQRRAYAAIYDDSGNITGFTIAVMLQKNIKMQNRKILIIYVVIALFAIAVESVVSYKVSSNVKKTLRGYEPDSFSAMYKIREDILDVLKEGIIAVNPKLETVFINDAAKKMLVGIDTDEYARELLKITIEKGETELSIQEHILSEREIIIDRLPFFENNEIGGAIAILHDRREYQKLMEDLAGTKYLVDSMRANNHDFTNKLHVILGLIQIGKYDEASSYIENITLVRQAIISKIMKTIDDPTVAALLIGKTVRASECNVKFTIQEGSSYKYKDMPLPQESLNTIIGNLIDNAIDSMNVDESEEKELLFGIHSTKGLLIISVDDTGTGILPENLEKIFENGFSTKGTGRGTGLYQTKQLIEGLGGQIAVYSTPGTGTSFTVSFKK